MNWLLVDFLSKLVGSALSVWLLIELAGDWAWDRLRRRYGVSEDES